MNLMLKFSLKSARYVKSAIKSKDFPILRTLHGNFMPEIAVAGRSNVGKSSLLNHLFEQRDLVKTSSVPGKTQMINFFSVDDLIAFVDLPGYGYAKVPIEVRKKWGPMIQEYLEKRPSLKLILLLFDIRRLPNDEDKMLLEWIARQNKSLILILTKVDKVTKSELNSNTQKILQAFNCQNLCHVHYSVTKNIGRKELIKLLIEALQEEEGSSDVKDEHGSDS
jgi:GTP-binding protein